MVPQLEQRWKVTERHQREIAKLNEEVERTKLELAQVLRNLSSQTGISINNTNELNSAISNSVDIQITTYNRAFDQLDEIVKDIKKAGGAVDPKTIEKIASGRHSAKLPEKIATMKSVVADLGGIVESVSKAAPAVLTAFTAIAKLFGG